MVADGKPPLRSCASRTAADPCSKFKIAYCARERKMAKRSKPLGKSKRTKLLGPTKRPWGHSLDRKEYGSHTIGGTEYTYLLILNRGRWHDKWLCPICGRFESSSQESETQEKARDWVLAHIKEHRKMKHGRTPK
jgi:hypothetical protein